MRIMGLDLSLVHTGLAAPDGSLRTVGFSIPKQASDEARIQRVAYIAGVIAEAVKAGAPDVVALEGYAYSQGAQAHSSGELGGVVKLVLLQHGVPWAVVPSTTLKKWATGKGTADKGAMIARAMRENPAVADDHQADAFLLRRMAHVHYGGFATSEKERQTLGQVRWPRVEG